MKKIANSRQKNQINTPIPKLFIAASIITFILFILIFKVEKDKLNNQDMILMREGKIYQINLFGQLKQIGKIKATEIKNDFEKVSSENAGIIYLYIDGYIANILFSGDRGKIKIYVFSTLKYIDDKIYFCFRPKLSLFFGIKKRPNNTKSWRPIITARKKPPTNPTFNKRGFVQNLNITKGLAKIPRV